MEGTLWKWTNYFSGWQPRWFVLDNGVLSYYKSQDDVNSGCKGSLKITVCDISVHPTDIARLDLIIPGEQHFYLKAATVQERQQWLVAIGSSKACMTYGRSPKDSGEISPGIVKTKKSELRLYCDLLMQQVHSVKIAVTQSKPPDVEKLDEATSLLTETCDTFIKTLEDCMSIANANVATDIPHKHIIDAALPSPSISRLQPGYKKLNRHTLARTTSNSLEYRGMTSPSRQPRSRHESSPSSVNSSISRSRSVSENSDQSVPDLNMSIRHHNDHMIVGQILEHDLSSNSDLLKVTEMNSETGADMAEEFEDAPELHIPTFFSDMSQSFMDMKFHEDGGIPVEPFLASCRSIIPIFDKLNSTAFAPVKMDFSGNIRKIQQKYSTNPAEFLSLQRMILYEVRAKQHHLSSSATVALLWMKRSLEFIRGFLQEILVGQPDLTAAASNAYTTSLKPYHGWVVRGVFGLAVKSIPAKESFLNSLAMRASDASLPGYFQSLNVDIDVFVTALDITVQILQDFYKAQNLDSDEQV